LEDGRSVTKRQYTTYLRENFPRNSGHLETISILNANNQRHRAFHFQDGEQKDEINPYSTMREKLTVPQLVNPLTHHLHSHIKTHSLQYLHQSCSVQSTSFTIPCIHKLKIKLIYDRQSVGQSVLVSGTHLGPATNFSFSLKFSFDRCGSVIL
jgi:hypothetical protein